MPPDLFNVLFSNLDKGLSAVLLIYFIVKILPALKKIAVNSEAQKVESENTNDTFKEMIKKQDQLFTEIIKLTEYLKYKKGKGE